MSVPLQKLWVKRTTGKRPTGEKPHIIKANRPFIHVMYPQFQNVVGTLLEKDNYSFVMF